MTDGPRTRLGVTLLEHAPEGEKQSSQYGEGAISLLKGLIRTLKNSIAERLGEEIKPDPPLMPWLVEHAAELRNQFKVLKGGKTAVENLRGRSMEVTVYEIGESVFYTPLCPQGGGAPRPKVGSTWGYPGGLDKA